MNRSAREYQQRPKKNGWQTRLHKGAKKTCRDREAQGAPQGAASREHSLWQREERREAEPDDRRLCATHYKFRPSRMFLKGTRERLNSKMEHFKIHLAMVQTMGWQRDKAGCRKNGS